MSHGTPGLQETAHSSNQEAESHPDSRATHTSHPAPHTEGVSRSPGRVLTGDAADDGASPAGSPPSDGSGRHSARYGRPRPRRRRREPDESPPPPADSTAPPRPAADMVPVGEHGSVVRDWPGQRIPPPAPADAEAASQVDAPENVSPANQMPRIQAPLGGSQGKSDLQPRRPGSDGPDCAICLQTCVHPVQLPCLHVFCFLCAKGAIKNSKRCAMCRSEVPSDYLENPHLLNTAQLEREMALSDGYQWYYEGRNGWWQYDERTAADLEAAFTAGEKRADLLVAGYQYVVDFETMLQLRRADPARRRRVKRDLASAAKKGVAGLRMGGTAEDETGLETELQGMTLGERQAGDAQGGGDSGDDVL